MGLEVKIKDVFRLLFFLVYLYGTIHGWQLLFYGGGGGGRFSVCLSLLALGFNGGGVGFNGVGIGGTGTICENPGHPKIYFCYFLCILLSRVILTTGIYGPGVVWCLSGRASDTLIWKVLVYYQGSSGSIPT